MSRVHKVVHLAVRKLCSRWTPRNLTEAQKLHRVDFDDFATIDDPKQVAAASQSKLVPASDSAVVDVDQLSKRISEQGDAVRSLKASKAEKAKIDEAVKALLELKAQYKITAGQDWKPGVISSNSTIPKQKSADAKVSDLLDKIVKQGDTVRQLKAQKADKSSIEAEVKTLLALKADYKKETGTDWTPNAQVKQSVTQVQSDAPKLQGGDTKIADLLTKIAKQGDLVRQLKGQKAAKATIDGEVKTLLELKTQYKQETGKDWTPNTQVGNNAQVQPVPSKTEDGGNTKAADLSAKIAKQGDQVRQLKAQKADKTSIDAEVKTLLALKAEFKKETGKDWTPNAQTSPQPVMNGNNKEHALAADVAKQGDVVRELKTKKADKVPRCSGLESLGGQPHTHRAPSQ
ncbi:hypothetical protein EVAR_6138_1 [Eumeta japonica]|uniref:WHEP-TRS domain-containing protein n=1 Tax=Eumeta variegata TaxID=151549 RepID=A0A4C1TE91_EUMVA|nr:hypothetical protein EVAR_6138_1 [Eumeta japonica]